MSVRATGKVTPLECPRCHQRISADDVNLELLIGLCRSCDATVELTREGLVDADADFVEHHEPPPRETPPEAMMAAAGAPKGLTVLRQDDALVIQRSWFQLGGQVVFLGLFCFVWDGFLVVWYSIGISQLLAGQSEAMIMLLFPVLHIAAGLAITYSLLASMVNRSTITVTQGHIRVQHGPLWWPTPDPVPTGSVDQLYLVQKVNKNNRTFALVARRKDMTSTELLSGLDSDVQARFLERRIESWLGLQDESVDGEYTG